MTQESTLELAALEAVGAASDDERTDLRQRLASSPLGADEAREIAEMAALIGRSLEPVPPPADVKRRVLAAIGTDERHVVHADDRAWREIHPGVRLRKLASNRQRNSVTLLLEMAPGSTYPGHSHRGAEESYVVRGSCRFGNTALACGDFFRLEGGESHGDVVTSEGCLLLVISDWADYAAA